MATDVKSESTSSENRIYVNNLDLNEIKLTCDEAVERILTRAPTAGAPSSDSNEKHDAPSDPAAFAPFKASHFHTDLRLVLGFIAATVMIGTTLWSYFIEKEWENNKRACAVAVAIYAVLSAIQAADLYWQGHVIFVGKRKMLSKRIETEKLRISSPALPKATVKGAKTSEGKPILTPPVYALQVDYARLSNGGKSLLGRKKDTLTLGHMGEWFTEEGEFIESIFAERLIAGLEKTLGQ